MQDLSAHIITTTFAIFGFPGNILVIILILRVKEKKSTTTCLLLSLAIADIVHILGAKILIIFSHHFGHRENESLLLQSIVLVRIVVNFILALLALERYNALVRAMKPLLNFTRKKVIFSVIIAWFTAFIIWLPLIIIRMVNDDVWKHSKIVFKIFTCLIAIFGFFVPLVIVVYCYSSILKGLYFDHTILAETITNNKATLREKKRLIRLLVIMTLAFVACNLPKIVIVVFYSEKEDHYHVVLILGCLSSSLNPYLYGLHSENYRNQIKQLFCKVKEEEEEEVEEVEGEENVERSPDTFDTKL